MHPVEKSSWVSWKDLEQKRLSMEYQGEFGEVDWGCSKTTEAQPEKGEKGQSEIFDLSGS